MHKRIIFLFAICVILLILYRIFYFVKTDTINRQEENVPEGEIIEVNLRYMGELKAYKEEDFDCEREAMEKFPLWWQRRERLDGLLGIEMPDWDLDFERHYYIVSYGRPLRSLSYDTSQWIPFGYEDWAGYETLYEYDLEVPYRSGIVYVYEMEQVKLANVEFG